MKYLICLLLFFPGFLSAQTTFLTGTVQDAEGDYLEGVLVQTVNGTTKTVTSKYGKYSLPIRPNQEEVVTFSFVGYSPQLFYIELQDGESQKLNVKLNIDSQSIDAIEITDSQTRDKASAFEINSKQLRQLPAVSGGVEALIKTLPGVRSNNELSSQYSVRGGNFDENVVYINDFEISRPQLIRSGQQEGLSVINSQMTDNIYFSAGGFEAQFGDKLSSVLAIQYNEPESKRGSAYAGFMGAGVNLRNQSKNKQTYYSVGGRYHTNKYLLNSLEENGEYNPVSYDVQALLGTHLNETTQLEFLGYASKTKYDFEPTTQNSNFGTYDNVLTFRAAIDGEEKDEFSSQLGGLKLTKSINDRLTVKFLTSYQKGAEKEAIDFNSSYYLGNQDLTTGEIDTLAQGTQIDFVQNKLNSNRFSLAHQGVYETLSQQHYLSWGIGADILRFDDTLAERDLLTTKDENTGGVTTVFDNQINSSHNLNNTILNAYVQDTYIPKNIEEITLTGGVRLSNATYTKELLVSPRLQASYRPTGTQTVYRLATGLYQQHPYYREFRNIQGEINSELKAQKSLHGIISLDRKFSSKQNLPFQFTAEAYYKHYWDVIPYEYDVMRIRYLAENNATAYVAGIDARLYGEFVKDAPSWLSLSILKTEEEIEGKGKVRRPTDQRINASVYWQDYFTNNQNFKVNLIGEFGGRLPVGIADGNRLNDTVNLPSYKRMDIGFSANLKGKRAARLPNSPFENIRSIWLSGELFNLFNIKNTSSYQWVFTPQGATYAVPNRLTSRRLNAKITIEF